jgi:hypothetical protein
MSADPDPGATPVQVQAGDGGVPRVDARRAVGVQVGQYGPVHPAFYLHR